MICSKQAMYFLQEVLPYLTLKKPEAEIAIRWQAERRISGRTRRSKEQQEKDGAVTEAQRVILSALKRQEIT